MGGEVGWGRECDIGDGRFPWDCPVGRESMHSFPACVVVCKIENMLM